MFLLFARRRATMPSFAKASREYGSIPCKTEKRTFNLSFRTYSTFTFILIR